MKVIDIIKSLKLQDFEKHYENLYGDSRDTYFNLDKLAEMPVYKMDVNFGAQEATFVLDTYA